MAYFGGGDSEIRARAQAHQIEHRARAEDLRRNPDRQRHEKQARQSGRGGRIMWGRLVANMVGLVGAVGLIFLLFFMFAR